MRTRNIARAITYTLLALAIATFLTVQWTWAAIAWIVAAACVTFVAVFVAVFARESWRQLGRDLDNAIAELSTGIDVDRHCAAFGHSWNHPLLALNVRVWTCGVCGERVESAPGWVDGRSAS